MKRKKRIERKRKGDPYPYDVEMTERGWAVTSRAS